MTTKGRAPKFRFQYLCIKCMLYCYIMFHLFDNFHYLNWGVGYFLFLMTISILIKNEFFNKIIFSRIYLRKHFLMAAIKSSHTLRKLNPIKSPRTPPISATRDWKEKANSSLSIVRLLEENMIWSLVMLGTTRYRGVSTS